MRKLRMTSMLLALGATACTLSVDQQAENLEITEDPLFVHSRLTWPESQISVCWINPSDDEAMSWTRAAIRETWSAAAAVDFVGWGTCASGETEGIRIEIESGNPRSYVGTDAERVSGASMWLNFDFETWSPSCRSKREACIKSIAVHEFGHALGFAHEQDRSDTPDSCNVDQVDTGADVVIGPWDENSVMNYCNPIWNNDGKLSAIDKQGVQATYGERHPAPACGRLHPGQQLERDQSLRSCDQRFQLVMQHDGNFVLYKGVAPLWHSATHNTAAAKAIMQHDGNLVVYTAGGTPKWHAGTHGHPGAGLWVQNDGNLVIYNSSHKPLWHSGTHGH